MVETWVDVKVREAFDKHIGGLRGHVSFTVCKGCKFIQEGSVLVHIVHPNIEGVRAQEVQQKGNHQEQVRGNESLDSTIMALDGQGVRATRHDVLNMALGKNFYGECALLDHEAGCLFSCTPAVG